MSEKIKSSDIFEGEIFQVLVDGAKVATEKVAELNAELVKTGLSFKKELKSSKPESIKDIEALIASVKKLNAEVDKQIKLNIEQEKLAQHTAKALQEQEKLAQQNAKTKIQNIKLASEEAKEEERLNKTLEKKLKTQKDLDDAYKKLSANTRDLKNESKRLGAEMLELEKQGKKNTAEYIKLARQYDEVTKSALQGDKALKKLDQQVGDNFRKVGNYENALKSLKGALMNLGLAFGIFDAIRFVYDTQVKLDSLNLALKNVSKTTAEYTSNFNFLVAMSKNYGQDLLVLIDTYKNFIASSESSNISLSGRKRLYESIIKSGSALALSNEDIEGSLRAVSQMFSKGTVSSEELRQQLGERLPGAFGIMAKSIGVSEEALNDMLKKGEVMADDVMPRFARELEKAFGKNATERLKTIGGAFNNLKTSIALYFDQLQKGVGINRTFAWILNSIANNIGSLISLTGNLIKYFIEYKTVVIALEVVEMARNKTLLLSIARTFGFATATETADGAVTKLKFSTESLGKALRVISFVAIIEIISYLKDALTGVISLQDKVDRLNKQTNIGITNTKKVIDDVYDKMNTKLEKYNYLLKEGEKGKEQYRQKEKEFNAESIAYLKNYRENLIDRRNQLIADRDKLKPDLMSKSLFIGGSATQAVGEKYGVEADKLDIGVRRTEKVYNQLNASIKATYEQQKLLNSEISDQEKILNKIEPKKIDKSKDVLDHTKSIKTINVEYNKTNEYLSKQLDLLQQLRILQFDYESARAESNADIAIQNEIDSAKTYGVVLEANYRTAINGERKLKLANEEKAFAEKIKIKPEKISEKYAGQLFDLSEEKAKYEAKLQKLIADYEADKKDLEKNQKKPKLGKGALANVASEDEKLKEQAIEITKIKLKIQLGYEDKIKQIKEQRDKEIADSNTQEIIDETAHKQKIAKINADADKKLRDAGKATTDELAQYNLNKIKSTAETVNQFIQSSLDYFIRVAERRMDILDKRMERMSTQADFLREKAVSGSIQAQESLAVIDKQQIENEKQRLNEQRSIQRIQMAMTVFQAYSNNIQNAKIGENPFTKTLTDITLLTQFISAIPKYFDGTEDTGTNGQGVDGKGGFHAILHPNERVIPKALNSKMGDLSNLEIAKLAEDFHRGEIMRKGDSAIQLNVGSWGTDMIVSKLESLEQTIKNKPESNIELGEIVGGVMHIMETKKSGNTKVRNISRFS